MQNTCILSNICISFFLFLVWSSPLENEKHNLHKLFPDVWMISGFPGSTMQSPSILTITHFSDVAASPFDPGSPAQLKPSRAGTRHLTMHLTTCTFLNYHPTPQDRDGATSWPGSWPVIHPPHRSGTLPHAVASLPDPPPWWLGDRWPIPYHKDIENGGDTLLLFAYKSIRRTPFSCSFPGSFIQPFPCQPPSLFGLSPVTYALTMATCLTCSSGMVTLHPLITPSPHSWLTGSSLTRPVPTVIGQWDHT